jgi:hypothetical protein
MRRPHGARFQNRSLACYFHCACRGGGMADAADLKSVVRKDVRVRLPPSAPRRQQVLGNDLCRYISM